jgi:hypothetical protein
MDYVVVDSVDFQEAIPAIIENIWKVSPFDQTEFLWALYLLKAPQTEQLVLAYIDSVDHYTDTLFTKSHLKILAVHTLFYLGNYSKYQLVFDELSKENPDISSHLIDMLTKIVKNIPSEEMKAKEALIKIAAEDHESLFRYYAISDLVELYGEEMMPFFIERFIKEDNISVISLIYDFLKKHKTKEINHAFKTKLPSIDDGLTRYQIIGQILNKYGKISDYKFLMDYSNVEIDTRIQNDIIKKLKDYKPSEPPTETAPLILLEELVDLTDTTYNYNWIINKGIYNSLSQKLENAKKDLGKGNDKAAKNILEAFRNEVEAQKEKHITIDGYKFLYYYSGYIIERL